MAKSKLASYVCIEIELMAKHCKEWPTRNVGRDYKNVIIFFPFFSLISAFFFNGISCEEKNVV